jgi:hypothetical protein
MRGGPQRVRHAGYADAGLRSMRATQEDHAMKLRRLMFPTANGPAVGVFEVDPPLLPGEVEICMDDPPTRAMNDHDLAAFFEARSAMGKNPT